MSAFNRLGRKFRDLSPAVIREIIVIVVILCLATALSIPQFLDDRKMEKIQKEAQQVNTFFERSTPQEQGMDPAIIEEASKSLQNSSALSLIIIRNGKVVYDKSYGNDGSNNIFSITKSFLSALTGIAIREGYINSVEDTIETYLPEYFKEITDQRWKDITIKHLLTMTPGFCENLDEWTASEDWVKATFNLPLQYAPGEKFQYANSASHLLSVVLTKATGMSTKDFAEKYLFQPLGIVSPEWAVDPDDYNTGYANIYLKPGDLAKFGWLYYSMGKWNGVQVVPEEWVTESTKVHYDFNNEKSSGYENGYGYKWWISGSTGYHKYSALGYGGQSINVIPDLGLEVVITCIPNELSLTDEQREELLKKYIIASIIN